MYQAGKLVYTRAMLVLGIESSCDETAAAVVKNGCEILSSVVASQFAAHAPFGGVVPEIASRNHIQSILPVVMEAVEQAGVTLNQLSGIAVTQGPGLIGSLLVGVSFAKGLAYACGLPLVGVNHIDGHVVSGLMEPELLQFPAVGLVVSGGHSNLYRVLAPGDYQLLGQTRDDAAGEAFDKVAKLLGLGFPGGPALEQAAKQGNPRAIAFPKTKLTGLEFSFSGLKTAVAYWVRDHHQTWQAQVFDVAASFQATLIAILLEKAMAAVTQTGAKSLFVCGGVARNESLRQALKRACDECSVSFYVPGAELCTDNAVMIAAAGTHKLKRGETVALDFSAQSVMT